MSKQLENIQFCRWKNKIKKLKLKKKRSNHLSKEAILHLIQKVLLTSKKEKNYTRSLSMQNFVATKYMLKLDLSE